MTSTNGSSKDNNSTESINSVLLLKCRMLFSPPITTTQLSINNQSFVTHTPILVFRKKTHPNKLQLLLMKSSNCWRKLKVSSIVYNDLVLFLLEIYLFILKTKFERVSSASIEDFHQFYLSFFRLRRIFFLRSLETSVERIFG